MQAQGKPRFITVTSHHDKSPIRISADFIGHFRPFRVNEHDERTEYIIIRCFDGSTLDVVEKADVIDAMIDRAYEL